MVTHEEQQRIWNEEHKRPTVLKQMDSHDVSGGVEKFWEFLVEHNCSRESGIEMGCGKGRNVIWLAHQGVGAMRGLDFSDAAITEAKRRAEEASVSEKCSFIVHDATTPWPHESDSMDFGIDCFASTDIESPEGREFAVSEMYRILKPGGYLLAYLLSTEDEFHKEMIQKNPVDERNAFVHDTGKFEKTFDEDEALALYKDFSVVKKERVNKTTQFFGKEYACQHYWMVFQKSGR